LRTKACIGASITFAILASIGSLAGCATGTPQGRSDDSGIVQATPPDAPTPQEDAPDPFPTFDTEAPDFGPREDTAMPDVGPAAAAAQLSLGHAHSCARLVDGSVRCWGSNAAGELGDGTKKSRSYAAPVVGLTGVAEVSAPSGQRRTCARTVDGGVSCWGTLPDLDNPERCLFGDPADWSGCTTSPLPYDAPPGIVELAQGQTMCARLFDGTALCFSGKRPNTLLDAFTDVAEIELGDRHGCLRFDDDTMSCWGDDAFGQLGFPALDSCTTVLGANPCATAPHPVVALDQVADFTLGDSHTCARLTDGTVRCWGANFAGQLGYGAVDDCTKYEYPCGKKPGTVESLSDVTMIAAGGYHTCALLGDRTVKCWGDNTDGELGFTTTEKCGGTEAFPCSIVPRTVTGLTDVVQIAAGRRHTCALQGDGHVKCWGRNAFGQLGDGTTESRIVPVRVLL
jgi:alpha-tubulin suppressor-like RCC1 family protein